MKVLVVPNDFPTAENPQAGIFILRRLQAMQQRGHDISVLRIVPYAPPFGAARWKAYRSIPKDALVGGIPVRTVRAIIPPRMIGMEYLPFQLHRVVSREIKRVNAELVHASYIIPSGQSAIRQSVPSIVTMHGIDAHTWPKQRPGLRRATRDVLRNASQMTSVSRFLAAEVQKIESCDIRVIWNGADERFFFPQPRAQARRDMQLPEHRFVIVYAGALDREKGVYELLDAARQLRDLRPIVVIVGTGTEARLMAATAERVGADVRMLGRLDQAGVARSYAAADVVALPSYIEGLPNVVCEAMLCERAIVATPAGGIPEIIRNDESGLLVEIGNADALATALRRAAVDEPLRLRLAAAARAFALQNLTWRNSARLYEELYEEVRDRKPCRCKDLATAGSS